MSCKARSPRSEDIDVSTYVDCPAPHMIPVGRSGTHHVDMRNFAPEALVVSLVASCARGGPLTYSGSNEWTPVQVTLVPPLFLKRIRPTSLSEKLERDGQLSPSNGAQDIELRVGSHPVGRTWDEFQDILSLAVRC